MDITFLLSFSIWFVVFFFVEVAKLLFKLLFAQCAYVLRPGIHFISRCVRSVWLFVYLNLIACEFRCKCCWRPIDNAIKRDESLVSDATRRAQEDDFWRQRVESGYWRPRGKGLGQVNNSAWTTSGWRSLRRRSFTSQDKMENPFRKYCANIRQPDQASDSRGAKHQHQLPADHFFASASARARHFNWKTSDSSGYSDIYKHQAPPAPVIDGRINMYDVANASAEPNSHGTVHYLAKNNVGDSIYAPYFKAIIDRHTTDVSPYRPRCAPLVLRQTFSSAYDPQLDYIFCDEEGARPANWIIRETMDQRDARTRMPYTEVRQDNERAWLTAQFLAGGNNATSAGSNPPPSVEVKSVAEENASAAFLARQQSKAESIARSQRRSCQRSSRLSKSAF